MVRGVAGTGRKSFMQHAGLPGFVLPFAVRQQCGKEEVSASKLFAAIGHLLECNVWISVAALFHSDCDAMNDEAVLLATYCNLYPDCCSLSVLQTS